MKTIGAYAFSGCVNLYHVYYDGTNEQWESVVKGSGNEDLSLARLHVAPTPTVVAFGSYWQLDSNGKLTLSGYYTSPDEPPWKQHLTDIVSVVINDGVSKISNYAFSGCVNLTLIQIPYSVTSIGNYAFKSCTSLTSITLPDDLVSFGNGAFASCTGLRDITIPAGTLCLSEYQFNGCTNLESVHIPASVSQIKIGAFKNCTKLKDIYFGGSRFAWPSVNADNAPVSSASIHYEQDHISGKWGSLDWDLNTDGTLVLSGSGDVVPFSEYTEDAWNSYNCRHSVKKLVLPKGITNIGDYAFQYCSYLEDIYYKGSPYAWSGVTIAGKNEPLSYAQLHYEEESYRGAWGSLRWLLDGDKLTISGSGAMDDFSEDSALAWRAYPEAISASKRSICSFFRDR